jgi:hypothetical protein
MTTLAENINQIVSLTMEEKSAIEQLEFRGAQRACHETPVERDRFLWGCRELILNFCR